MNQIRWLILLIVIISTNNIANELDVCKVIRVVDGDTVEVEYNGEKEMVRLYGIDTPEKGEDGFDQACNAVKGLIEGKTIRILLPLKDKKRDNFGRLLGILFMPEYAQTGSGVKTVNQYLYYNGLARLYMDSLNLINKSAGIEKYISSKSAGGESTDIDVSVAIISRLVDERAFQVNEVEQYFLLAALPMKYRELFKMRLDSNIKLLKKYQPRYSVTKFKNYINSDVRPLWGDAVEVFKAIIALGGSLDIEVMNSRKLIHYVASVSDNPEVIDVFAENGVDIDSRDKFGGTPLCAAIGNGGNIEVIKELLKLGADIDVKENSSGESLLFSVVRCKFSISIIGFLIENGADVNTCDASGTSLIAKAVNIGISPEVIDLLIKNGADKNVYFAALISKGKFAKALELNKSMGALKNTIDDDGDNLLHKMISAFVKEYFSAGGLSPIKRFCDEKGNEEEIANPNCEFLKKELIELIEYFIAAGVDINKVNNEGKTPLDYLELSTITKNSKEITIWADNILYNIMKKYGAKQGN